MDFEQLKAKYESVLGVIAQQGVRLDHLHVQDGKLFMQGAAPSEDAKNAVWNQIKAVDPSYSDLTADLAVDTSLPAPAPPPPDSQKYTVAAGDSLWKIAKNFYGEGHLYTKIFDANRDILSDPNVVQVGQELVIPPK